MCCSFSAEDPSPLPCSSIASPISFLFVLFLTMLFIAVTGPYDSALPIQCICSDGPLNSRCTRSKRSSATKEMGRMGGVGIKRSGALQTEITGTLFVGYRPNRQTLEGRSWMAGKEFRQVGRMYIRSLDGSCCIRKLNRGCMLTRRLEPCSCVQKMADARESGQNSETRSDSCGCNNTYKELGSIPCNA